MDLLDDLLTTRSIQTGWEFTFELYPSWQFGFIDNPDCQFGNCSVWTWTQTQSDGPEVLLTRNVGASIFHVKGRTGGSKWLASGEYVESVYITIVIMVCCTSIIWKETRWRAVIVYRLLRYWQQNDKISVSLSIDKRQFKSFRNSKDIYKCRFVRGL